MQQLKLAAARAIARYEEAHSALRRSSLAAEAEELLREILSLTPSDGLACYSLGHILRGKTDFAGAVAEYSKAVMHDRQLAQDPELLVEWASSLDALGDQSGALQVAQELASQVVPNCAESHRSMALVWYDLGELDGAIWEFREALRLLSGEHSSRSADIHCGLGMALFDQGDVDGAVAEYRAALRCDPRSVYAHANLGNALFQQGALSAAITQYRRALRCDPSDGDVSCNLGDALYQKGRLRSAIRVYRAAASRSPNHVVVRCKLANALYDTWDLEGAVSEYEAVLSICPGHWEASYNLWFTKEELREMEANSRRGQGVA